MGAWGTAISSNDTYADIYGRFMDLYDEGGSVADISRQLINENQETIADRDDANNFWFALANAQWECKQLDQELYIKIKTIIDSENDLQIWERQGGEAKNINKRRIALTKFLEKLQTERPKARNRKRKVIRQPVFEKGDCVIFNLENGNYGGLVVLDAIRDTELGLNLFAVTRINQKEKPTNIDFEHSKIMILSFASWQNRPFIGWYYAMGFKKAAHLFEKVGSIRISREFKNNMYDYWFSGDFDSIIKKTNFQYQHEGNNCTPYTTLILKEFINS